MAANPLVAGTLSPLVAEHPRQSALKEKVPLSTCRPGCLLRSVVSALSMVLVGSAGPSGVRAQPLIESGSDHLEFIERWSAALPDTFRLIGGVFARDEGVILWSDAARYLLIGRAGELEPVTADDILRPLAAASAPQSGSIDVVDAAGPRIVNLSSPGDSSCPI